MATQLVVHVRGSLARHKSLQLGHLYTKRLALVLYSVQFWGKEELASAELGSLVENNSD